MTRVALEVTVLIQNPLPIRRPACAKVEMIRVTDDAHPIFAVNTRRPDLVAARAREVKRYTASIRAETQSVRQPLAGARELAGIGAVEVHAENLPDLVPPG